MILSKVPYRGHHLVLLQHSETFQIRILDGRNNAVQLDLSTMHATEEAALDEARRKLNPLSDKVAIESLARADLRAVWRRPVTPRVPDGEH